MAFSNTFVQVVPAVSPVILNTLFNQENDTFKKSLALEIEYFVDTNQHFLLPFLHCLFTSSVLSYIVIVIETLFIHGIYYNIGVCNTIW